MRFFSNLQLSRHYLPLLLAIVLPLSLTLWLFYYILQIGIGGQGNLSPIRCLMSIMVPTACFYRALRDNKLDTIALVVAFAMGFVETLANYCIIITTVAFFLAGTKATKYKRKCKEKFLDEDEKEGKPRNWIQVISNGGVGLEIAILLMIERGPGVELPIDFKNDYLPSILSTAYLGSIACACGDTLASELAPILASSPPRLIVWPLMKVPKGTNGGVTTIGLLFSVLGGFICGLVYYLATRVFVPSEALASCPPQWPIIVLGTTMGLVGSIIDSILGATVQYSGFDEKTGFIVSQWRPGVHWISGFGLLDNHSVNLMSTLISAIISPLLAHTVLWSTT